MATVLNADISPVLIAVDLHAHSTVALQRGLDLAVKRKVPALVLHVVHETGDDAGFYSAHNQGLVTTPMRDIAKKMLAELVTTELKRLSPMEQPAQIVQQVVEGIPGTRIAEVADQLDACCIVMASSGHSGLARIWFGSVVEAVKRHTQRELYVLPSESTETHSTTYSPLAEPLHPAH